MNTLQTQTNTQRRLQNDLDQLERELEAINSNEAVAVNTATTARANIKPKIAAKKKEITAAKKAEK